CVRVNTNFDSW
nr:immunoglobulin heavy chain junction region [Macaca mulatta]MOV52916.1 immunoglobulin heavy chain junction region [Macaca mulatta]